MRFTKMHGLGNDYIYINGFEESIDDPVAMAQEVSDRHTGIGGDGLILILPSKQADARMRIFNADGSEAEMCGNGLRCVTKFVYESNLAESRGPFALPGQSASTKHSLCIETGNGLLTVGFDATPNRKVDEICVNMGQPKLSPKDLPVLLEGERVLEAELSCPDSTFRMTCVSMGNPHAVIFVDDLSTVHLDIWGPQVECHALFPQRTNVHFVQVVSQEHLLVKTWERGSGITQACGTGACACCVAGVLTNRTGPSCTTELPGGDLKLTWNDIDNCVYMTGPAVEVFTGEWPEN